MSAAAHRDLPHANPLSTPQFDALVETIAQDLPRNVLDIGCGWGSFAIALAEVCDAAILGIDINSDFLSRATSMSAKRTLIGQIDFREASAAELSRERFDAVVCIGAAQAFGTPLQAIEHCTALLTDAGVLLFAELVWAAEPPREFLDFLGIERSMYWRIEDAERVFERAGLVIRQQEVTSAPSWQAYEDGIHRGRLRFAEKLSASEAAEVRARAANWTSAWQRWGQHCLGFVAYIASRAA